MKKIEDMDIFELDQLKNVVKGIVQKYDNMLTTYGILNNDKFLQNMPREEQAQFDKKNAYTALIGKIDRYIEEGLKFYEND